MAKRTKQPAQAGQDWSAPAAELLAELPADRDGLLAAAVAAVVEIDAAVMRGDGAAAELAGDRYEAIIWKLNGGTNFGCMADDEAAGRVIERHCAAVPGDVPLWGQRGQFLAVAGDVRALVEYEAGYGGPLNAHFQFHAVDLDRPFISATGYRSHFDTARGCMTVDEVARGILTAMLAEKKRPVLIEANYRDRLADAPLPDWLAGLVPPARREPAGSSRSMWCCRRTRRSSRGAGRPRRRARSRRPGPPGRTPRERPGAASEIPHRRKRRCAAAPPKLTIARPRLGLYRQKRRCRAQAKHPAAPPGMAMQARPTWWSSRPHQANGARS